MSEFIYNAFLSARFAHRPTDAGERRRTGAPGAPSTIRGVERRKLADYEWVQAVHVSSEIRNYVTIYLATATLQVGVLATFSIHQDNEEAGRREMDIMMPSLKIHQQGQRPAVPLTEVS
jgi:hypothetical protein